jgi:hypothetical protein
LSQASLLKVVPVQSSAVSHISELNSAPRLAVSALDNVSARRDVADALAEATLDCGVDGLQFHVSRHQFGDGLACAYCDYVDVDQVMDQAAVYSKMTGLEEDRVEALLAGDSLTHTDVTVVRQSISIDDTLDEYVGARLADLVRARLYAQAMSTVGDSVVAVSAPYVSALAGAVLASEVQKESEDLAPFRLNRRIDIDCSGYPTGILTRPEKDASGRCLCSDEFRLREYASAWR